VLVVPGVLDRLDSHSGEQASDFVAGQRDLPGRLGVAGVLGGGGDG
jgi:hypothetical protein